MAQFYSLALEFTPLSNKEMLTALLCNRCLAFIKLKKFKEALADAEKCIKIRPDWFRVSRYFCFVLLTNIARRFHVSATQELDKMLTNIKDHDIREKRKMFLLGTIISQGVFFRSLDRNAIGLICTPASHTTYVHIEYIVIYSLFRQGHSRQGTCLCHLKRKKEALEAFCKAHTSALNEKEENATACDVISTAMEVDG